MPILGSAAQRGGRAVACRRAGTRPQQVRKVAVQTSGILNGATAQKRLRRPRLHVRVARAVFRRRSPSIRLALLCGFLWLVFAMAVGGSTGNPAETAVAWIVLAVVVCTTLVLSRRLAGYVVAVVGAACVLGAAALQLRL